MCPLFFLNQAMQLTNFHSSRELVENALFVIKELK